MDERDPAQPWPLRSYLALAALPEAVPCARLHARLVVCEWGLRHLAATVELVVSELVTNGLQATSGLTGYRYAGQWRPGRPPLRLWVQSERERVLVQVWDAGHHLPVKGEPAPGAETGRGLLLVEALSVATGVYRVEGATGKVVWTVVAVP
jgi:anti-sigma regulatory factor (Ser/Thr protein kinase)